MKITITREHEICCGHRVVGHEGKCQHLHGHGYRFEFTLSSKYRGPRLDPIGRVVDFAIVKNLLCQWLEDNWDHKTLLWNNDPYATLIRDILPGSIVIVPFNPTAEHIGKFLLQTVGPAQLADTDVELIGVKVHETSKCSATVLKEEN